MKKILKNNAVQWFMCWLLHKYCCFVMLTSKTEYINTDFVYQDYIKQGKSFVAAFWHGRLLLTPFVFREKSIRHKIHVVVSRHGDGELISKAVTLFGVQSIRGSTNRTSNNQKEAKNRKGAKDRGGMHVLKTSLQLLNNGEIVAYTPDGPKGPCHQVNEISILKIASKCKSDIIPINVCCSKAKYFKSWDKFMLPLPFGKIKFIVGDPITIAQDCDENILENTRKELENSLNSLHCYY